MSNDLYWSTSSGGPNDTTAPVAGDDVVFDGIGGAVGRCDVDIPQLNEINFVSTYTGDVYLVNDFYLVGNLQGTQGTGCKFETNGFDFEIDGDVILDGDGQGIRRGSGDTVYLGGDFLVTVANGGNTSQLTYWRHSKATPTLFKEHNIINQGFGKRLNNQTIGDNQTIILNADQQVQTIRFMTGSAVKSDGTQWELDFRGGTMVDPHLCSWGGVTSGERVNIRIRANGFSLAGADYNDSPISMLESFTITGHVITTGTFTCTKNGFGTATSDVLTGSSLTSGNLNVGSSSQEGKANRLRIFTGAYVVSQNLTIRDDDTIKKNSVEIADGAYCTVNGVMNMENHSHLEIPDGAVLNVNGGINWNSGAIVALDAGGKINSGGSFEVPTGTSTIVLDGTVCLGTLGGTISVSNADNSARIAHVEISDGAVINQTANFYGDDIKGPDTGSCEWIGTSKVITQDAIANLENIICNANTDGGIQLSDGTTQTAIGDYGNWAIDVTNGKTLAGSGDLSLYRYNVFSLQQNTTQFLTIGGSINLNVTENIKISDTAINNRGGVFIWDSDGTLTCGEIETNDIDGIQRAAFMIGANGSGDIHTSSIDINVNGEFDASGGPGTNIYVKGVMDVDPAALTIDMSNTKFIDEGDLQINWPYPFDEYEMAAAGFTTTFNSVITVTNKISFGGGTIDQNGFDLISEGSGDQFIGSATWSNSGADANVRLSPAADTNLYGPHGLVSDLLLQPTADAEFLMVDAISSLGNFLVLHGLTDGVTATLTLGDEDVYFADAQNGHDTQLRYGIINLQNGSLNTDNDIHQYQALSEINTDLGLIDCEGIIYHHAGAINNPSEILARDYQPFAGAVLSNTGDMELTRAFNPADTAGYSASWGSAGSLTFVGDDDDKTANFSGASEPKLIFNIDNLKMLTLVDGPILGGTVISLFSVDDGTHTEFVPGVNYSVLTILSTSVGTGKNVIRSQTPGSQYDIALQTQNEFIVDNIDVEDSDFANYVIYADIDDSIDSGNNYYDGIQGFTLYQNDLTATAKLFGGNTIKADIMIDGQAKAFMKQGSTESVGQYYMSALSDSIMKDGASANNADISDITFIANSLLKDGGNKLIGEQGAVAVIISAILRQSNTATAEYKDCTFEKSEETALDRKMLPLAQRLIRKFGKTAKFTELIGEEYNPFDGSVSTQSHTTHTAKIVPPYPQDKKYSKEGNTSDINDLVTYVAGLDVNFEIKIGMRIDMDCEQWTVMRVRPIRSGGKVAVYELALSQ